MEQRKGVPLGATPQSILSLLQGVSVPEAVVRAAQSQNIAVFEEGISGLPHPLCTASIWLACNAAWPHTDDDFEGTHFINLAIQAHHSFSQALPGSQIGSVDVRPGTLFLTNPLCLHWLSPSDQQLNGLTPALGYIGLQWEVPYLEAGERLNWLLTELGKHAQYAPSSQGETPIFVTPEGEYAGSAPGHEIPSLLGPQAAQATH